jgi:hypothetical protein
LARCFRGHHGSLPLVFTSPWGQAWHYWYGVWPSRDRAIEEVLLGHLTDVLFPVLMLGGAALAIFRPVVIVRWAKRAHPDLPEDDETILWIARLIGVGILGIAMFILVIIVRSFSG